MTINCAKSRHWRADISVGEMRDMLSKQKDFLILGLNSSKRTCIKQNKTPHPPTEGFTFYKGLFKWMDVLYYNLSQMHRWQRRHKHGRDDIMCKLNLPRIYIFL